MTSGSLPSDRGYHCSYAVSAGSDARLSMFDDISSGLPVGKTQNILSIYQGFCTPDAKMKVTANRM